MNNIICINGSYRRLKDIVKVREAEVREDTGWGRSFVVVTFEGENKSHNIFKTEKYAYSDNRMQTEERLDILEKFHVRYKEILEMWDKSLEGC